MLTEQRLAASNDLDALSVEQTLHLINEADAAVPRAVQRAIPQIKRLVDAAVARMRRGGRLIYLGAGTSGRLGVLDASECPPTFHSDPQQVIGLIAGGDVALRRSSEGAEDRLDGARADLTKIGVGAVDVVVGIAAGGTTPYVVGALRMAREQGAATGLICCASPATDESCGLDVDHRIELLVGAEVLTGSTRMKAGTATKLVLNMISTTVMVQLGKVWGNLMVDLRATNTKLRDRAVRILSLQCALSRDEALALLERAGGRVKLALVMAHRGADANEAKHLLERASGKLRSLIGPPREGG